MAGLTLSPSQQVRLTKEQQRNIKRPLFQSYLKSKVIEFVKDKPEPKPEKPKKKKSSEAEATTEKE